MSKEIAMKIHKHSNEIMLAACDAELIGKTFKDGKLRIEISADFYDEVRTGKELFLKNLRLCTISNLVGEKVIQYAIEDGFVDRNCVLWIKGVPHAQTCSI